MQNRNHGRVMKMAAVAAVALTVIVGATAAEAQDREGRWELGLAALYQFGTDLDFDGGSSISTDGDFGFVFDGGYNLTDNFAVNFGLQWAGIGYKGTVIDEDGESVGIRGSYDSFALFSNAVYYFGSSALAPYVGAGIGYTWIDTKIPSGPPITGCWWDPWYGYVCYTSYPTEVRSAFSYQALLGVRYDFGYNTYVRFAYTSQWISLSSANGTPRFDVLSAEFGWIF
ncbi:MAG: outer membrane beta-barrel protein [Candidatus Sulfomarinibacteraceae bacterium]